MNRRYNNPPVEEALCDFQFIPGQPWDMTIPGLLYEKIRDEFPIKEQQMGLGIGFRPKEGGIEQRVEIPQRMQFLRSDKSSLVQVGRDLLTINQLKPYPTWETFKPMILQNLKIYQAIAKPKGLRRIGLRYINKITFEEYPIEATDYFNYYPTIPTGLPQMHEAFHVKVEIPYEDGGDRLLLTFSTATPGKSQALTLVLDLDYIMAIPERVPIDQADAWVEKAHKIVEAAFEACVTDKCRNLFGEKN